MTRRSLAAALVALATSGAVSGQTVPGLPTPALPPRDRVAPSTGTGVVRGMVVDLENGRAIRRATVILLAPSSEGRSVSALTDDAGRFELTDVPTGRYGISASKRGYYGPNDEPSLFPPGRPPIVITAGQTVEKIVIPLGRGGAIVGRIADESGEPAVRADVRVMRRRSRGLPRPYWGVGSTSSTDDTGAFRIWGLPPGEYIVGARAPEPDIPPRTTGSAARTGSTNTFYPGSTSVANAAVVTVRAGQETGGVSFALIPARLASIRGTVSPFDASRRQSVMVRLLDESTHGAERRGARVDADGSFEVAHLPPGRYEVSATERDAMTTRLHASVDVALNGVDVEGVLLTARPGASITGRIVTETGEPIPGGWEKVAVGFDNVDVESSSPFVRPTAAQPDGTFRVEGLYGRKRVRAYMTTGMNEVSNGFGATSAAAARPTWQLKSVTMEGRDVTDDAIDFDRGDVTLLVTMTSRVSEVRGRVAWNRDVQPERPSVVVFLDDPDRWEESSRRVRAVRVRDDGTFAVRGLPPGDRYLAVAVEGPPDELRDAEMLAVLRPRAAPLRIDEGGVHELSLTAIPRPR